MATNIKTILCAILCHLLVITSADNATNGTEPTEKLISSVNNFTLRLLQNITTTTENVFISGFSVATVLTMLLVGTRDQTATEIQKTLGYGNLSLQEIENTYQLLSNNFSSPGLDIGNSMWIQEGFSVLKDFQETVAIIFGGKVSTVNFANDSATGKINEWVGQTTNRKINHLFDTKLDASIRLLLANVLYFNGTWMTKFNKQKTLKKPFYIDRNNSKMVDMMKVFSKFPCGQIRNLDSKVLELPYEGKNISMIIILPNDVNGIEKLQNIITTEKISDAIKILKPQEVHVRVPRFSVSTSVSLKEVLKNLGINLVFEQGKADLSGIDGKRDLYVDEVIQKAVVEVTEDGTVASAASSASASNSKGRKEFYFTANHPFLYFVRNNVNGMLLFMGKYSNP